MLDIADRKARDAGIEKIRFQQGTLDSVNLERQGFDAVMKLNVLHLLEDVDYTISIVHDLLNPGGVFISSTALIDEISFLSRLLIPLMLFIGLAPYVNRFSKQELVSKLTRSGLSIDREWQPGKESFFSVAKKQP